MDTSSSATSRASRRSAPPVRPAGISSMAVPLDDKGARFVPHQEAAGVGTKTLYLAPKWHGIVGTTPGTNRTRADEVDGIEMGRRLALGVMAPAGRGSTTLLCNSQPTPLQPRQQADDTHGTCAARGDDSVLGEDRRVFVRAGRPDHTKASVAVRNVVQRREARHCSMRAPLVR